MEKDSKCGSDEITNAG